MGLSSDGLHAAYIAGKLSGKSANITIDAYTKSQSDAMLDEKVDKVEGKGLSTNDYTDAEKQKLASLNNYDDAALQASVDANTSAIAILNGTGTGSVSKAVTDKIAEVVGDAPESFDTLKEVSDWINSHASSAAEMNSAIQENTAALESKVDKEAGKGLSTNDYTNADKSAVQSITGKADQSALTAHTENSEIHVTAAEKAAWNGKASATDLAAHVDDTNVHITATERATIQANATAVVENAKGIAKNSEDIRFIEETIANLHGDDVTVRNKIAEHYFMTNRTGKVFGTFFHEFSISNTVIGTRMYDSVGMVAEPSTDTIAARNDFEQYVLFNGLTCNGYVDEDGEFIITAFEGEEKFSKTTQNVWVVYATPYIKIDVTTDGMTKSVTDTPRDGYVPMGNAIRTDLSVRPFIPMCKYLLSNQNGTPKAVSGAMPYYNAPSYNWGIDTIQATLGNQYCMQTVQDKFWIDTMFEIVFATRDSQSIMQGCTNYNYQYTIAKAETDVNRILVTTAQATNFVVGSYVSVGEKGSNTGVDRNSSYMHNIVNRRKITKIENVTVDGTTYGAIYIDGETFSTTTTCTVSSMPWITGATDNVLGTCGSPKSNTNGKYPCKFLGLELFNGQWEVLGNGIFNRKDTNPCRMHICYDSSNLAKSITENYVEVGYDVANSEGYCSKVGYDENNPCAGILASAVGATSTTGYADYHYINTSIGTRELLVCGHLSSGAGAGLWSRAVSYALSNANWHFAARLSGTGRSGNQSAGG